MPAPLPARACPPRATRDRPGSAACPASTVSCYRNQCLDFPQGKAPASLSPQETPLHAPRRACGWGPTDEGAVPSSTRANEAGGEDALL